MNRNPLMVKFDKQQGIHIPQRVLEAAGLTQEKAVFLSVEKGQVVLRAVQHSKRSMKGLPITSFDDRSLDEEKPCWEMDDDR